MTSPEQPAVSPLIAYLAVFIGVCGHASSEFVAVLSGVSGPEVSVWRYLLGSLGLVAVALLLPGARDLMTPLREQGVRIVWLSLYGITGTYLAFHWALDFATVIQVATIVTTIPVFVGLANMVVNRVPLTAPKVLAAAFAISGIVLLVTDGYLDRLGGGENALIGIGLALICATLGAGYAVQARPLIQQYGGVRIMAISLMLGGIFLWLLVGAAWSMWVNPLTLFDRAPVEAWSLFAIALWNTTITQLLWFWGLSNVPDIVRGSSLFFLKPVIAAFLALYILAQPISLIQVLAIVVICMAVLSDFIWAWLKAPASSGPRAA